MAIRFNDNTSKIFRGSNQVSKVYRGTTTIYQLIMQAMYKEISFVLPGTYTWVAPAGVTSVSVVAIGGGGGGRGASSGSYGGGGGGGLGWKNNIPVTPGQSYTVVVGSGGASNTAGGDSYFIDTNTVAGFGGGAGISGNSIGGTYVGDGGGNGGSGLNPGTSDAGGGGGAGGYTGNGGNGADTPTSGLGGGGGGGKSSVNATGSSGGGGTGLYGQGTNGSADINGFGGWAGSGGYTTDSTYSEITLLYGGGGLGEQTTGGEGARGAVRIIWGEGRSFPSNAEEQYFFDTYDDELFYGSTLSNVLAGTDGTYAHVYTTDRLNLKIRRFNSSKVSTGVSTVYTTTTVMSRIISTMFANGSILVVLKDSNMRLLMVDSNGNVTVNQIIISGTGYTQGNLSHNRAIDEVLVALYNENNTLEAWKVNNAGVYSLVQSVSEADLTSNRSGLVSWAGEDRVQFYSTGESTIVGSTWDMTNNVWVRQNGYIVGGTNLNKSGIKVFTRTWNPKEAFLVYNSNDGFMNIGKTVYNGDENYSRLFTAFGQDSSISVVEANIDINNQLGVIFLHGNSGAVFYQEYDLTDYAAEHQPTKFKYITNAYSWETPVTNDIDNPYGKMPISVRSAPLSTSRLMFVEI